MKTCPHCSTECEDNSIVCQNCGYLFPAQYFEQSAGNNPQGSQPQNNGPYNTQYPHGPYNGNYYGAPMPKKTNGLAIAGMVLSIIGLATSCCGGLGTVLAIPGLIISIIAVSQIQKSGDAGKGMAIAGIVCGALGTLIGIYYLIIIFTTDWSTLWEEYYNEFRNATSRIT